MADKMRDITAIIEVKWYDHIIWFPPPSPRSTVCRHFLGRSGEAYRSIH